MRPLVAIHVARAPQRAQNAKTVISERMERMSSKEHVQQMKREIVDTFKLAGVLVVFCWLAVTVGLWVVIPHVTLVSLFVSQAEWVWGILVYLSDLPGRIW